MPRFSNSDFEFEYLDQGSGDPVVLIHGFASNMNVNWVSTGWVRTLTEAGYRVLAFDNRGHGGSTKSHDSADYFPGLMAEDAIALLEHAGIGAAHVMGYSMGARISAFMAKNNPERTSSLILGGLGMGLVSGIGNWDAIGSGLLAEDAAALTNPRVIAFRKFADQTGSDRKALAACIATTIRELSEAEVRRISAPTLVAVGTRDDIAGEAAPLVNMLPRGTAFDIAGRDHMLAVGDKTFKNRVLAFLAENPI